jgi:hypothetical protein
LISPILHTAPGKHAWRSQFVAIWNSFILHWHSKNGRYSLSVDASCQTHIRLAMPNAPTSSDSALPRLKQLAQAAGHFGPALRDLMRPNYRGDTPPVREWTADNATAVDACKTEQGVINLMNPDKATYLGFNFLSPKVVEFRLAAACRTTNDFFRCAALATMFLRASVKAESTVDTIRALPPDVNGLGEFVDAAQRSCDGYLLRGQWKDFEERKALWNPVSAGSLLEEGEGEGEQQSDARERDVLPIDAEMNV